MKKPADKAWIVIGRIGSIYGVQGWIKINSYAAFGANILDYMPWYLEDQNNWHRMEVENKKINGHRIIVKLSNIHTPEEARLLTGKNIAISRSQLPTLKSNEYYWSDLEALTVVHANGTIVGKVAYLIETGSNDVLVVKGDKEYAIPYLPNKVIKKVDLVKGQIIVDWDGV
ncbi:MAG TPA: ribosome maturation factor RimM [Gammaproteobacteria bacterium]|nr:ribosome maturation factor RimM [Gammaproteobacteria bacterium]